MPLLSKEVTNPQTTTTSTSAEMDWKSIGQEIDMLSSNYACIIVGQNLILLISSMALKLGFQIKALFVTFTGI